jgi:hypothetical protein
MERKSKGSSFKMKSGNKPTMSTLAGITKPGTKQADGRAKSSAFQKGLKPKEGEAKDKYENFLDRQREIKNMSRKELKTYVANEPGTGVGKRGKRSLRKKLANALRTTKKLRSIAQGANQRKYYAEKKKKRKEAMSKEVLKGLGGDKYTGVQE